VPALLTDTTIMKYLFLLLPFLATNLKAQTILKFDQRLLDCENKWVVFQMNKDTTFNYGFTYLDLQAGLTFNYEGNFKITHEGAFVAKKLTTSSIKYRITPNNVKVAIIPVNRFTELGITEFPEWLKIYGTDTASIARLYKLGFVYNTWNECAKALTYLERAQKIDPAFKGLALELAFAYNALGLYDKTISVLQNATEINSNDYYLYKELSFAEMNLGQLEKASETCKKGISVCSDNMIKSEMAYNIAFQYYKVKDKINFKYWADETKKWAPGDRFRNDINVMEHSLQK
jgi:tetratricopeptide (TPR) repeat protein